MSNKKSMTAKNRGKSVSTIASPTSRSQARGYVAVIPRYIGWAFPRLRVSLRFHKWFNINNVGSQQANHRFVPTFAYDVDPTVGSTAMPGFAEYGAIYRFYRVRSAKVRASFSNAELFPVTCYLAPVNIDPTANYNAATAQQYLSSRLGKSDELGPLTGAGTCTLVDRQTTAEFGGARDLQVADTYCASTQGGAPGNNWYWTVGIISLNNFVSGVNVNIAIDIEVEFFELASPAA